MARAGTVNVYQSVSAEVSSSPVKVSPRLIGVGTLPATPGSPFGSAPSVAWTTAGGSTTKSRP
jgi:hypothetical protein